MTMRSAKRERNTRETQIAIGVVIDGTGVSQIDTGVPFFDHMLMQLSKHGAFDLEVDATGDLHIDTHHTIEDTGILLGETFRAALGDKRGVRRFASISVPLDEARIEVTVDLSGRPFFAYDVELPFGAPLGSPPFDAQLAEEFWRAFVMAAGITLHIRMVAGKNVHHIVEASFKGVARAMRDAVCVEGTGIPSTKGTLGAEDRERGDLRIIDATEPNVVAHETSAGRAAALGPIEMVALDFNGTLLADADSYVSVNVELGKELGLRNLTSDRYRRLAGTPGQDWTHPFRVVARKEENEYVLGLPREGGSGRAAPGDTMESIYQTVYEARMKEQWARWARCVDSVLAPGTRDVVSALRNDGVVVTVISTQHSAQIEPVLELAGVLDLVGSENIHGGALSKSEKMRHVAATHGTRLGRVLYVGDERKDLADATETGAQFAHVSNGVNARERVLADSESAGHRITLLDGIRQVPDVIAAVNGRASADGLINADQAMPTVSPTVPIAS